MQDSVDFYLKRYKECLDLDFEKARLKNNLVELRYLNDRIISICALRVRYQMQKVNSKYVF